MTGASEISMSAKQKAVESASRAKNPLEFLTDLENFSYNDLELSVYCKRKADMDAKTLKWAFKLAERNVGPYYQKLSMGWQPKIKQADLNKTWARFVVAEDKAKNPVAYAMFRFDLDYGNSVLYCYEMQIEKNFQRRGIGRYIMEALEKCAIHWKMEKIILTILKNNDDGKLFFTKLGYSIDETSPDKSEQVDYEIMSKMLI